MHEIDDYKKVFAEKRSQILEEFYTFLRFKSIATDPNCKEEVIRCADWLADYLRKAHLNVEKWETENAPVIFASNLSAGSDKETLLIYCHYDVQPIDPLDEWKSHPFEPEMRDGEIFARGACDNKGQCFYTILAIKTLLKTLGQLPVNLKFLIEGEEESGSLGLSKLLPEKKEILKADHILIVDSGLEDPQTPAVTLGARGIVCMQVSVQEANFDLHSGLAGGIAYNPNRALSEMLAALHDTNGSVSIPGFYDEMIEISPYEKKELSFDFDVGKFHSMFGFEPTGMEKGITATEAGRVRPTLEINGMWGGYTGPGFKTVIPAKAFAKLSCRLVPNQTPDRIAALVSDFLIKNTPAGFKTDVYLFEGSGRGFRTNPHSRIAQIMSESYSQVFQSTCQKILIGGSIPVAAELAEILKADMVLVGLSLADDHVHAPNEHFGVDRLEKGFLTICRAIELFA